MSEYAKHDFDGDNMDGHGWQTWIAYILSLCFVLVRPGGVAAVFCDWRQLPALSDAMQWAGWVNRGLMVWDKKNARPQPGRPRQQCEFILWASKGALSATRNAKYLPGLFSCAIPAAKKRVHQTEKPLELMRQLVHICEAGGQILDPFCGSGNTILAAYLEGFTGHGIEKNDYYARLSRERLEDIQSQTIL